MICGFPGMQALVRDFPDMALVGRGASQPGRSVRIAPELLIGKLFRLMGADAVHFPEFRRAVRLFPENLRPAGAQCPPDR